MYDADKDCYYFTLDLELFQKQFADQQVTTIFQQLDNLKTLGMLTPDGIKLSLMLNNGYAATSADFSNGQFQLVYIYAIVELFKDRNCLTLLDEPDAFLHPEWQFEFFEQVFEITGTANRTTMF